MESVAKLRNCPYSPRKMRLMADLLRGKSVHESLNILKFHSRSAYALKLEKLLLSALSNWQQKNEEAKIDDNTLFIKTIFVDNARMLKRIQPAPQGRAHRIRKRSNHVTLVIDNINSNTETVNTTEK